MSSLARHRQTGPLDLFATVKAVGGQADSTPATAPDQG
jgi:hypothetical protein